MSLLRYFDVHVNCLFGQMWLLIWSSVDSFLLRGCLWWGTHGVQISSFRFCCGVHNSGRAWCATHLGWGDRLSTPQDQRLLLHEPWLLRRKEGLPARPLPHIFGVHFLCVAAFFGGGRIGTSPFLLTMLRSSPEEEGQAQLLTNPARTSEGRDTSVQFIA